MGYKHTAPALQAPGLTTTERAVLALVAEFTNVDRADSMHHKQEQIADRLEVSREAVLRALAKAERLGYVTRYKRFRDTPEGKRRDRDTVQVHHDVIAAATEAKLDALRQKWDNAKSSSSQGIRDEKSHTYVTRDHVQRDEKSQHNRELNKEENREEKTPSAASAALNAGTGEKIQEQQGTTSTDRWTGKRDHQGVLYESVPKAALIAWAHYRVHGDEAEEHQARDYVLATFRERNGDQFADWAEEFGGLSRKRAQQILDAYKADGEDGARYEAGAIYGELLNAAPLDEFHPADVENGPRVHREAPLHSVDRRDVLDELQEATTVPEDTQGPQEASVDELDAEEISPADQSAALAALIAQQETEEKLRQQETEKAARWAAWEADLNARKAEAEERAAAMSEDFTPTAQDWKEAREVFPLEELPRPEDVATIAEILATEPIDLNALEIPEDDQLPGQEILRVLVDVTQPRQEAPTGSQKAEAHQEAPPAKNGPESSTPEGYRPPTSTTPWAVRAIPA